MDTKIIQNRFLECVKEKLPVHLALVDEVADILDISQDSAYRRIRGETSFTFTEIKTLSVRFGISVDEIFNNTTDVIAFNYRPLNEKDFSFQMFMDAKLQDLVQIEAAENKEVIYLANDIPLPHLLHVPEIASFKMFFWKKTILDYSELADKKFALDQKEENGNEVSRKIRDIYIKIPTIEIYNAEALDVTLKQIEYYHVSGLFEDSNCAVILCDKLSELLSHIQNQAAHGFKFKYEKNPDKPGEVKEPPKGQRLVSEGNYKVYYNEVLHTDTTILARMDNTLVTYLANNSLNLLTTTNHDFYEDTYNSLKILLRKSTLISGTSEKERNKVFLKFQNKISDFRKRMEIL
ncbi:MAG: hypothetical protein FVQ77_07650 [Cytophagales bacterium]|nr:hypothetical protein [Cytophagales bacterium]